MKPGVDFEAILAADPVICDIRARRAEDREDRRREALAAMLGAVPVIMLCDGTGLPVPPPTPGVIATLQLCDSPFLGRGEPDARAALPALYGMIKGRGCTASDHNELAAQAASFFGPLAPPPEIAAALVARLLREAFAPYRRLPPVAPSGGEALAFDAAWLAGLVARVGMVTRLAPDAIIWDTPMVRAAWFDLECRKIIFKNGDIRDRSGGDRDRDRWFARVAELRKIHGVC